MHEPIKNFLGSPASKGELFYRPYSVQPGTVVKDSEGREYAVMQNYSLRRLQPTEGGGKSVVQRKFRKMKRFKGDRILFVARDKTVYYASPERFTRAQRKAKDARPPKS